MKNRIISQRGSLPLVVLGVVLLLAGVGGVGWYVWQKNRNDAAADRKSVAAPDILQEQKNSKPLQKTINLLNGAINFTDDGVWKVAVGGYSSIERGCGQAVDSDEDCLDHKMLIPTDETFSNPDQFQVNISVFKGDDVTSSSMLGQWIDKNVSPGGSNPKRSSSEINGNDAYRYEVTYDENDVRLVWGVLIENKIVVIQSNFFRGDHYSYVSSTDYMPFIASVDKLVETIR